MANEKFKDILEAALLARYDGIPNPEDLDYDYEFSPEFEKKMQEMIENFSQIRKQAVSEAKASMDEKKGCRGSSKKRKHSESYGQKRSHNIHFRKALAIALVSALLMALAACAVHYVVIWNETNNKDAGTLDVTFDVGNPMNGETHFKFEEPEIPKAYQRIKFSEEKNACHAEYKDSETGNIIYYSQTRITESMNLSIDNESHSFSEISLNGHKGYSIEEDGYSFITWEKDLSLYTLSSNIAYEALFEIAKTIV